MSFSGSVQKGLWNVFDSLPRAVGVASVSAGISYLAGRTTTRVSLPSPLVAAKFTAAIALVDTASAAFRNYVSEKNSILTRVYVINSLLNPGGSVKAGAKLEALAYVSSWVFKMVSSAYQTYVVDIFTDKDSYRRNAKSIFSVSLKSIKKIYNELPQTILATIVVGLASRFVRPIGLDPKTAMIFTVATAALRGANPFLSYYRESTYPNNLNNTLLAAGITMGVKHHYSHLKVPGYATIGKGFAIALLAIEASGLLVRSFKE